MKVEGAAKVISAWLVGSSWDTADPPLPSSRFKPQTRHPLTLTTPSVVPSFNHTASSDSSYFQLPDLVMTSIPSTPVSKAFATVNVLPTSQYDMPQRINRAAMRSHHVHPAQRERRAVGEFRPPSGWKSGVRDSQSQKCRLGIAGSVGSVESASVAGRRHPECGEHGFGIAHTFWELILGEATLGIGSLPGKYLLECWLQILTSPFAV